MPDEISDAARADSRFWESSKTKRQLQIGADANRSRRFYRLACAKDGFHNRSAADSFAPRWGGPVSAFFRTKKGVRSWVAVAASYAFVLQLMLTGIAATQMAAANGAELFVICHDDGASPDTSGDGGTHANHQTCAVCTFVSSTPLLSALPVLPTAVTASRVIHAVAASRADVAQRHDPRSSQGPPQNA
jgi:hypothetical protein